MKEIRKKGKHETVNGMTPKANKWAVKRLNERNFQTQCLYHLDLDVVLDKEQYRYALQKKDQSFHQTNHAKFDQP